MYTGTVIDELMETVERTTSQSTESGIALEMLAIELPQFQDSLAGAA